MKASAFGSTRNKSGLRISKLRLKRGHRTVMLRSIPRCHILVTKWLGPFGFWPSGCGGMFTRLRSPRLTGPCVPSPGSILPKKNFQENRKGARVPVLFPRKACGLLVDDEVSARAPPSPKNAVERPPPNAEPGVGGRSILIRSPRHLGEGMHDQSRPQRPN